MLNCFPNDPYAGAFNPLGHNEMPGCLIFATVADKYFYFFAIKKVDILGLEA